jgi:hypothetical protein
LQKKIQNKKTFSEFLPQGVRSQNGRWNVSVERGLYIYTHTHRQVYTHTHAQTNTHTQWLECVGRAGTEYIYVYINIHTYIYIYIHTYIRGMNMYIYT